ncbi:MAG TPA: 4-(cytidine 5'-diphospho)-2-C-methyl-D-erythritol kinase [Chitinophagaceae bacterium]|jgi:4-diphosphocytidyl-2-C-methyl-D-erythritol kinase|nr:4-(cytidine 5'-diphospho)-2-C-methyl-D-erythritol kinase [Chitinophagaceae bacterium]
MIIFPNSKINLGLRILRKRNDGYHDLETVFYPIPLTDTLEITRYNVYMKNFSIPFTKSGFVIDGDPSDNLCIKAYKMLRKDFPQVSNIQMHLHKAVPAGAGLGGGSADAAFTLILLNKEFKLGLSTDQLTQYALKLGSDCPFFIINKPCYATGRGEMLQPLELDLSAYKIVVVNPGIHINTGRAFLHIKPGVPEKSIKEIISRPIERWKDELFNDFEKWVFAEYREIVDIKDQLYVMGAVFASMSGSGSTVYGIFPKDLYLKLPFPEHYFTKELMLN